MTNDLPDNVITGGNHRVGTIDADVDEAVLDDIMTGEQEVTYVGNAHDGFEIDNDWEEFSVNPASGSITFQGRTHKAQTLTTNHFSTPGLEHFEDAGLVDTETGELTEKAVVGGVVLESFDDDPSETDAEPVETFVFANCEIAAEGLDYGETDPGNTELTIYIRGKKYALGFRDEPAE
ncbi:hypothetical protein [Natrarchaeobaculum sulfurireducens]|uniref:Uncharacterized protein n=1 Tax=Natrarchaeobaculum sulfurireducens TaxID=2044521 RepID=A0A346PHJ0_9EURY|nr:hypothetical protein [Natrarchaeobaculum sulfurireducens]AXR78985.1 hypothetical protein AArc1_2672 [Natrarchaeobaculum sulfurireducens]